MRRTGGVIEVTTKGLPINCLIFEYESSRLFDDYNYDLLGFVSRPIYRKLIQMEQKEIRCWFFFRRLRNVDDSDPSRWSVES